MQLCQVRLLLLCCALPLLAGAKCTAFFSSGGSGDDEDQEKPKEGLVIVIREGELVGATAEPVAGVTYRSGGISGVTDADGRFEYADGAGVRFSVGDIVLGRELAGKARVTPLDLVEAEAPGTRAAVNIARLLAALDRQPGAPVIRIPARVAGEAVADSDSLYWAVQSLDFDDEVAFLNAASALVAGLTRDYPFTAVLPAAEPVRAALAAAAAQDPGQ